MTALSLFPEDDEARAAREREHAEAEAAQRRRWAEHDADFTPPDVCRLGAWAVRRYILANLQRAMRIRRRKRLRILGPCAGAGPWLAACREFFPEAELRAMDIREEERPHLAHHVSAENVQIGDFLQWRPATVDDMPDLILDNLPFKLALEFLQHGQDVLAPGGIAVWFVRLTLGDRDAVNNWLEANRYSHRFEFVDRFKFRVGINPKTGEPWGVDSTGYKLLGFTEGEAPDTYVGKRLPSLPPESRRWRKTRAGLDVRPGTEYMHGPDELEPSLWMPPER